MADIKERIFRIQNALGVSADGIVGPDTLTAAETALGISMVSASKQPDRVPVPTPRCASLACAFVKGLEMIVRFRGVERATLFAIAGKTNLARRAQRRHHRHRL